MCALRVINISASTSLSLRRDNDNAVAAALRRGKLTRILSMAKASLRIIAALRAHLCREARWGNAWYHRRAAPNRRNLGKTSRLERAPSINLGNKVRDVTLAIPRAINNIRASRPIHRALIGGVSMPAPIAAFPALKCCEIS